MLKSLHIGRYTRKAEDFRKLVAFFEAIGFDRMKGGSADRHSAVLTAPIGMLSVNALSPKYPTEVLDRLKDVAKLIVLEVTNPDDIFVIVEKMKLKVLMDSSVNATGERSFSVELPGEIVVTVHGQPDLPPIGVEGSLDATGKRFAIVVSRFNAFITERLLAGAMDGLRRTGASEENVTVIRVPGAFEIPSASRTLAETKKYDAVIALGCLLRGDTAHYDVIVNECARGIGQSAQETGVPHAFGVLTCDTLEQAIDRAGLKMGNKGFEAAMAAVEMASLQSLVSRQAARVSEAAVSSRPSGRRKSTQTSSASKVSYTPRHRTQPRKKH
jgi:6,7-dimethyl-8-ribityllumazine synthase